MKKYSTFNEALCATTDKNPGNSLSCGISNHYTPNYIVLSLLVKRMYMIDYIILCIILNHYILILHNKV